MTVEDKFWVLADHLKISQTWYDFVILLSEIKILYTLEIEIDEIYGNDGHIYRLRRIDEIQEILTAERDKRNELSTKYNRGVNIIGVIDNCLGVTAIGLGITAFGILSTIVAAPVVIEIEEVSFVMGLRRVVSCTKSSNYKTLFEN